MTHATGSRLVAVHAFELLGDMSILRQDGGLGKFSTEITVSPSQFTGSCVAHKGAPAAAGKVR